MPGILCEHCTAACCRYLALPIDTPETHADFDDLRWYLLHEGVSVFVEDGEWFICMQTACRHLLADNRCSIYQTRPNICRNYTAENCDYHSGDYGWEHHFTSPEHIREYMRAHANTKRSKPRARTGRAPGRARMRSLVRPARKQRRPTRRLQSDTRATPLPPLPGEY